VDGLDGDVDQHQAGDDRGERPLDQGERKPRDDEQAERGPAGALTVPAVGEPAGAARGDGSGDRRQAEEADGGV
jgi:hypothetical protein